MKTNCSNILNEILRSIPMVRVSDVTLEHLQSLHHAFVRNGMRTMQPTLQSNVLD